MKPCPGTGHGCLTWIPADRALCRFCEKTVVLMLLHDRIWALKRVA